MDKQWIEENTEMYLKIASEKKGDTKLFNYYLGRVSGILEVAYMTEIIDRNYYINKTQELNKLVK